MATNYPHGLPNPEMHGFFSLGSAAADSEGMVQRIAEAAASLNRPCVLVEDNGYQCEIIAATTIENARFAWVEAISKKTR